MRAEPGVTTKGQPVARAVPPRRRGIFAELVHRTFPALHQRNYRLFFSGQLVSLTGTWTQQLAQGWLVWTISHSALLLGVVTALQSLPVLFFGLRGGIAADRLPRRRFLLGTEVAAMLLALLLALLTFTGTVGPARPVFSMVAVGVLAFCLGTVNAFDAPARQAFVVELVGKRHLLNAISLNSSVFNGARIIGPALAGVLIRFVGVPACFLVNGLSFVPVIAGLCLIRTRPQAVAVVSRGSLMGNLRESMGYAWRDPLVRDLYLTVVTISVLVFSYATMLPLFADQVLHSGALGYSVLSVSAGVGALVAALSLALVHERRASRGRWIVLGAIGMSLSVASFSLSTNLALSALALALGGFSGIAFLSRANTALQTGVPDQLRGRAMSVYILLLMAVAPIGAVQLGVVANLLGAPRALAAESVLAAVILALLHTRRPTVREAA